ncbi:MAG: FAD-dependent thymidylate synthase [Candidatus Eiseniibacteriota bacterium]
MSKKKDTYVDRINAEQIYTVPELARLVDRTEFTIRNLVRLGALQAEKRPVSDPRECSIFIRGTAWMEFAERKHYARVNMRPRLSRALLRSCEESTGEIKHTRVVDIWRTGVRPVFRVTLDNGYRLTMTKDHRCLTVAGWMTLEQATRLNVGRGGAVSWDGTAPAFAVNGELAHRNHEWLKQRRAEGLDLDAIAARAGVTRHTIRKCLQRFGLQFTPKEKARLSGLAQRGQKRTPVKQRVFTDEWRENVRRARSGEMSNFWKGGVTPERANIARWTRENAAATHKRFGFRCVLCGDGGKLCAHHLDPVWNNPARAREADNLITICDTCHRRLHNRNLEMALYLAVQAGSPLEGFWGLHPNTMPRPVAKTLPTPTKLVVTFSSVVKIEYLGEQETYDLEVEGPDHNFVANGFIVHNSVNEYSARYSVLDKEFYLPDANVLASQTSANRQGRGDAVSPARAVQILEILKRDAEVTYAHYEDMLGGPAATETTGEQREAGATEDVEGIARELARINLSVGFYTQWYWKIDLHNLLRFISLRADAHAQYEIRVYAEALASLVQRWVPDVYEAFVDYQMEGANLSRMEVAALRALLRGEKPDLAALGMSVREQNDFKKLFNLE